MLYAYPPQPRNSDIAGACAWSWSRRPLPRNGKEESDDDDNNDDEVDEEDEYDDAGRGDDDDDDDDVLMMTVAVDGEA